MRLCCCMCVPFCVLEKNYDLIVFNNRLKFLFLSFDKTINVGCICSFCRFFLAFWSCFVFAFFSAD